jgi:preprotein translocase subunit SecG
MHDIVLVIHLILTLTIIGLVLLQRSSGGGLGTGGGGLGDFATARGAATALSRMTMICAFLFFATSLTLAIIDRNSTSNGGLLDQYSSSTNAPVNADAPVMPAAPDTTQSPVENMADPAVAPNTPVTPEPPISSE